VADFCKQCSIDLFGDDFKDLAGITDPDQWSKGKAATVICEGCGPIQIDPDGNCVSEDCMCQGQRGHGLPWVKQGIDFTNLLSSTDPYKSPEPECKPVSIRDASMGPPYDMELHMADPCPECGGFRMQLGDWACWGMCYICADDKELAK